MPSILPGYEYDIFISYRHNDNRSGWVTEFARSLQEELAATIKEQVSVYFDTNPHDGLLETHDVGKSLEGKLKCLIFIPILSQTYCDRKSFAWQHEFVAFNRLARGDQFGRDIKLTNGNVASRILPLKIHDLDAEDKATLESEMGGVIRAIEFIFQSPGVNRPLRANEDNPNDNQGRTFYRDQINKVANAIKEIITSLKTTPSPAQSTNNLKAPAAKPRKSGKGKIAVVALSFMVLFLLIYGVSQLTGSESKEPIKDEDLNRSIAVLPFLNMSNDADQEFFSDGVTEQIITNLAHVRSLKVIARTSVMKFKKTTKSIAEIGKELNVTHVLEGSIRKAGNHIRVTAQLIAVHDESHIWAQDYDKDLTDIFTIQDDVSMAIVNSLSQKLTPGESKGIKSDRSANVEAYEHYLRGIFIHNDIYFVKFLKEDFVKAENEFKSAIRLDPAYALAYAGLADLYDSYRNFSASSPDEARKYEGMRDQNADVAMSLDPENPYVVSVKAYTFQNKLNKTDADTDSAFKYQRRAVAIAPNNLPACAALCDNYKFQGLFYQSIRLRDKIISLDPSSGTTYSALGSTYLWLGDYQKAESALEKGLALMPDNLLALTDLAFLHLLMGNTNDAEQAIHKIKNINQGYRLELFETLMLAVKGDKEASAKRLKNLKDPRSILIYLVLGMKNEALDLLQDSSSSYLFLMHHPLCDGIRDDPRFKQIAERQKAIYDEKLRKYVDN